MLLTVRCATLDDVPAILAVEQPVAAAVHWPAEEYGRLVATGVVLVAEQSDKLCGFICAKAVAPEWEIENVVVATEFLRRGIADRLMRALIDQAEMLAVSRILLEVRESNRPARRLYEKHGFREVGRRRKYYSNPLEDAILCERRSESEK